MYRAKKDDGFKIDKLTDEEKDFMEKYPKKVLFKRHPTRPFVMFLKFNMPNKEEYEKKVSGIDILSFILNCKK